MSIEQFLSVVETQKRVERASQLATLQENAVHEKDAVVRRLQEGFPLFFESCKEKILAAQPAFLNNGAKEKIIGSSFGAPGILIDHLIFAFYRSSKAYTLVVGVYQGLDPATILGEISVTETKKDQLLYNILIEDFLQDV